MRSFWDEAAQRNAAYYVDTTLDYDAPDMQRFFADGARIVSAALDGAPVAPPHRRLAVEIGSGLGRNCLALADRFERVVGLDISPAMVRRAAEVAAHPRVTFQVADGSSLSPLPDGCADLVFSFTVFQHVPHPGIIDAYLADAARVLAPGGVLAFQWNDLPRAAAWRAARALAAARQRVGLGGDSRGRDHAAFRGSRVPARRILRSVARAGLVPAGTRDTGTLFAWAWATAASAEPAVHPAGREPQT